MINHTTKKFLSHRENKVNKNPLEKETNVMANDGTSLNEVKGSRATTFRQLHLLYGSLGNVANVSVCLLGEEKLDFDMRDDFVQVSLLILFQQTNWHDESDQELKLSNKYRFSGIINYRAAFSSF